MSVRALARACNLTTGAIYSRFKNKTELLVAAVEGRMALDLEADAVARSTNASGRDPDTWRAPSRGRRAVLTRKEVDVLEATVAQTAANYPAREALRALLLEGAAAARRDSGVRANLRKEQLQHLDWWVEVYQSWKQQLDVDPAVDVTALLRFLWAAELGLGILEAYGITPPSPEAWRDLTERVMRSMHK